MRSLNDILADCRVEIFTEKNPSKRVNRPETCRLRHLAFCVDSVEQTVNELAEAGIECEPIRVDDFTDKNLKEQMDTAGSLWEELFAPIYSRFSGLKSNQNKKTAHHDRCV